MAAALRLLLATQRAGVGSYFRALPTAGTFELVIDQVALDTAAIERSHAAENAAVAVVDAEDDAAAHVIAYLRSRRAGLPVIALLCCSNDATPSKLRALSDAGATGMLDLHATPAQTWETISTAARGNVVVQLRLAKSFVGLRELVERDGGAAVDLDAVETQILELLGDGRSDHEMAAHLFLSPHTIKHRVEALRRKAGARNRIALAAWAGRNGATRETEAPRRAFGAVR